MDRILLVRTDGIGDFVIFSAVLETYRQLYRAYRIDLVCHPNVADLARPIPFVDRVIPLNTRKLFRRSHMIYTASALLRLRSQSYEKALYPVYSRRRRDDLLVRFLLAREKIAFDGDNANDRDNGRADRNRHFTLIIPGERRAVPEIARNAEFLKALGADVAVEQLRPRIWFTEEDQAFSQQLLREHDLRAKGYVALFPGASDPVRHWDHAKWAELSERLLARGTEHKIVLLGHGQDAAAISAILQAMTPGARQRVVNLCGMTGLRVLGKLIEGAQLLVGAESAGVHIAAAVGTPGLCLMGGGHFGRFYPYGDLNKNRVVYRQMDCYGCNWHCRYDVARCIREIRTDEVLNQAVHLLSGAPL